MNKIESYIDSVIPKNIPKSKQQKLKSEIESHIYDRIDFYTDIGYDTDSSINKALADMGEDEETKTSIRNDFEELHHEHIFVSVLTGLGMLFLHFLSFFFIYFYYHGFDDYVPAESGKGNAAGAIFGLVSTFIVIMALNLFYKKGYRKSLIALGISNLLTFYSNTYIFCVIYSLYEVIAFGSVKIISVKIPVDYLSEYIIHIISYCLLICFSLVSFGLTNRLKHYGKPEKHCKTTLIFCIVYLIFSVFIINFIAPSEMYFHFNPGWFNTGVDLPDASAKLIYDSIDQNTTASVLETQYGYTTIDKYVKKFDEDSAKKIIKNYEEMEFFFGEDYEVWFNPDFIEQNDDYDGNGFIYIQTDENGYIKSKGVGNAFKDLNFMVSSGHDDIPDCLNRFLSYDGGESLESVIDYFEKDQGLILGAFTTYTEIGEDNYYRIYLNGYTEVGLWGSKDEASCQAYIELWFKNGKLTEGKFHYPDFYYEEGVEGYSLAYNSYYTLAD